jgi:SAM-dependent methyltransferase
LEPVVSWYAERILPRVIDLACGAKAMSPARAEAAAGLRGVVVELGFGSGHNCAHYPEAVESVLAVEPSDRAWELAAPRVANCRVPVSRAGLDGERLPFSDASADSVLSTFTLCTIPDLDAALAEVRRVLRPGGAFHFFEHGLAPDHAVQRWQRRAEPIQKAIFGGCHLTRPILPTVQRAGFDVEPSRSWYAGRPRAASAMTIGVARAR